MGDVNATRAMLVLGAVGWLMGGCSGGSDDDASCRGRPACSKPPPNGGAAEQFDSDPPAMSTPASGGIPASRASVANVLAGAEFTRLQGDRLIAFSKVSGLSVIDVADPNHLVLLGQYPTLSTPQQLYVRGDVAIVLSSAWFAAAPESGLPATTLQALDLSDPSAIQPLTSIDIPGEIEHATLADDTLYVVTDATRPCAGCKLPRAEIVVSSYDLRDPRAIERLDELRYAPQSDGYPQRHSALRSEQRIYVATTLEDTAAPQRGSTIQIVDISDSSGRLALGASAQARGTIAIDWHMDEYQGVLRVASDLGGREPVLQTFRVVSTQEIQPIAQLDLELADFTNNIRFDGPRAYVFGHGNPVSLHAVDLADPSRPKQLGKLDPARISHVEALGNRLLTVGESNDAENTLALSLYDATETGMPRLLSRVHFGGRWSPVSEPGIADFEQLRLLSDAGLVLAPFFGYDYTAGDLCSGRDAFGLQLVDYEGNQLIRRGSVKTAGPVRRTLLVGEHVLAIGDELVQAFAIHDRTAPVARGASVVGRNVEDVAQLDNGVVARVINPGTDNLQRSVEFVAGADAEDLNRRVRVVSLLEQVVTDEVARCGFQLDIEDLHADGNRLYVVYRAWAKPRQIGVLTFDASDPSSPQLVGKTDWDDEASSKYVSYTDFDRMPQHPYVWRGSTLALLEKAYPYGAMRLRVVDLSDPANPTSELLPLPAADNYVKLSITGDTLFASRFAGHGSGRVRYFVDRFDISEPRSPRALGSINTPGALMHYFPATQLAITRSSRAGQSELQLITLADDGARLVDSLVIDRSFDIRASAAGDGVVFVTLGRGGDLLQPESPFEPAQLLVLDLGSGRLRAARVPLGTKANQLWGFWGAPLVAAQGKRALLVGNYDVAVVDAKDPAAPKLTLSPTRGSVRAFDLRAGRALFALGHHGLQSLEM